MLKSPFPPALVVVMSLALLTGCESPRVKSAAGLPPGEAGTTVDQEPTAPREIIRAAALQPLEAAPGDGWHPLFDGTSLTGWRVTDFGSAGRVEIQSGLLVFRMGAPFVGVNYTNEIPKQNYEVTLDAMRIEGDDFFCGLTFPVGDSYASLIVGGWGGSLVGISSIDHADASENETTQSMSFETGRWYRVRLRVSEQKVEAWIDRKKIVEVERAGHEFSLRAGDIELSKPFGLASWTTSAAFRDLKLRAVTGPDNPAL